jgi:putative sigma-54 modulation protein
MKLQIFAKNNLELSETMREYIEEKIGKLGRYLPAIGEGKVEVFREDTKSPDQRFSIQVTLDSKGTLIRAQERADDIRTALDKVVDVLTKRIERYKGKLYDKGWGTSLVRQSMATEAEVPEISKKVIREKHFLVKPMDVDEAINQMELLGHDFFLFINSGNDKVNLLYRRKDGNYGIIEPKVD